MGSLAVSGPIRHRHASLLDYGSLTFPRYVAGQWRLVNSLGEGHPESVAY